MTEPFGGASWPSSMKWAHGATAPSIRLTIPPSEGLRSPWRQLLWTEPGRGLGNRATMQD